MHLTFAIPAQICVVRLLPTRFFPHSLCRFLPLSAGCNRRRHNPICNYRFTTCYHAPKGSAKDYILEFCNLGPRLIVWWPDPGSCCLAPLALLWPFIRACLALVARGSLLFTQDSASLTTLICERPAGDELPAYSRMNLHDSPLLGRFGFGVLWENRTPWCFFVCVFFFLLSNCFVVLAYVVFTGP